MESLIGIDIGTTNIKVVAYGLNGERLAYSSRKMLAHHPEPDFSEYDPEEIWSSVCLCLKEINSLPDLADIKAISVASMGEAQVTLDKQGHFTYPVISWFDTRTCIQADLLRKKLGVEYIYSVTGQFFSEKYGINKLLWIKENRPESFENTTKWLSMEDFIIFKLSGEYATDYSIAARTMAFDIVNCVWSDKILETAGISKNLLPSTYPGGTMVGKVSSTASADTGLKQGIPVITGGHDHACAAMGVKGFEQGVILDSMGTAEATMIAVDEPKLSSDSFSKALCMYPHCGQRKYRVLTSIQACGGSIEWFLSKFGSEIRQRSAEINRNAYDILMEDETKNSPPGASGLLYIPYIRGSLGYPNAKGAFIGIKDSHSMGDYARAIIEGLCYELKNRVTDCGDVFGSTFTNVRAVGGITRSDFWMQTKADILGCEVEVPNEEEAASLGAALLAGIGAGIFKDEVEASNYLYRPKKIYCPTGEKINWDKRYQLYRQSVWALMSIYDDYSKIEFVNDEV